MDKKTKKGTIKKEENKTESKPSEKELLFDSEEKKETPPPQPKSDNFEVEIITEFISLKTERQRLATKETLIQFLSDKFTAMNKDNTETFVDGKQIDFLRKGRFHKTGEHTVIYKTKAKIKSIAGMFDGCSGVKRVKFRRLVAYGIKDVSGVFRNCTIGEYIFEEPEGAIIGKENIYGFVEESKKD
ncbi:MAG: hypothetical protein MJ252_30850 [archaeon]|nr:hypothetical protein [archaeon]